MRTHNCGISSKSRVHPSGDTPHIPPSQNPAINSYLEFSLFTCHPNLFLRSPSRYQSPFFPDYPLSDFQNTPTLTVLAIFSFSILFTWSNHRKIPSSILSSILSVTPPNYLIHAFGTLSILYCSSLILLSSCFISSLTYIYLIHLSRYRTFTVKKSLKASLFFPTVP